MKTGRTGSLTCSHTNMCVSLTQPIDWLTADVKLANHLFIDPLVWAEKAFLCQQGEHFLHPTCSSHQSSRQRASLALLTIYWAPRLSYAVSWPGWGTKQAQIHRRECACVKASGTSSYLVLLQLQLLHVVELLRLQLAHPVVQLVDLVPAGDTSHVIGRLDSFAAFQKRWHTSVCLRSGGRCSGVCVWQPESSSSSLSQSLSYLLSSGRPDLTNTEDMFGN